MEMLNCQSGYCNSHEIRRCKWEELQRQIVANCKDTNGYIFCEPCAEKVGLLPNKLMDAPWRKNMIEDACQEIEKALTDKYQQILNTRLVDTLSTTPENEKRSMLQKISAEVNAAYVSEWNTTFSQK